MNAKLTLIILIVLLLFWLFLLPTSLYPNTRPSYSITPIVSPFDIPYQQSGQSAQMKFSVDNKK